jgi:hypothetical protein
MDKAVTVLTQELLEARRRVSAIEAALKALGGSGKAPGHGKPAAKRHITAEGRRRMAAAGRKRWAQARKAAKAKKAQKQAPESK